METMDWEQVKQANMIAIVFAGGPEAGVVMDTLSLLMNSVRLREMEKVPLVSMVVLTANGLGDGVEMVVLEGRRLVM